jgi:acetyl esterase/lipase
MANLQMFAMVNHIQPLLKIPRKSRSTQVGITGARHLYGMRLPRAFDRMTAMASAVAAVGAFMPAFMLNVLIPGKGYTVAEGIAYGADPRQRLDVYSPTDIADCAPVLVYFYGGRWKSGKRSYYRFVGEAFATRGYLVVVPDYRLYPSVRFPAFVEDGARALKWVERNASRYGGNPQRIILSGHSAGAHLAALLLFDQRYLGTFDFCRNRILGFIGLAGPYAFNPLAYESTRVVFSTVQDPDQARPIAFVDGSEPPVLLMHGGSDDTVEMANAQELAARVRKAGGEARFIRYARRSHIGLILSVAAPFRGRDAVYADMLAFMDWLCVRSISAAAEPR